MIIKLGDNIEVVILDSDSLFFKCSRCKLNWICNSPKAKQCLGIDKSFVCPGTVKKIKIDKGNSEYESLRRIFIEGSKIHHAISPYDFMLKYCLKLCPLKSDNMDCIYKNSGCPVKFIFKK